MSSLFRTLVAIHPVYVRSREIESTVAIFEPRCTCEIATYFLDFDRERCRTGGRVLKFHRRWRSADRQPEDVIGVAQDLGKLSSGCNGAIALGVLSCLSVPFPFFFLSGLSLIQRTKVSDDVDENGDDDNNDDDDDYDDQYYRIDDRSDGFSSCTRTRK